MTRRVRLAALAACLVAAGSAAPAGEPPHPAPAARRPVGEVVRPAPGGSAPAARPTKADRRRAVRARIFALRVELAGLERSLAAASAPRERAILELKLEVARRELIGALRAAARLHRSLP